MNPSSQTFADIGIVSTFAEAYGSDVNDLYHELHQAKRLLQRMKVEDRPVLNKLARYTKKVRVKLNHLHTLRY